METTGPDNAYAVQIAAVGRRGTVVFNEYFQPNATLEPAAVAAHGITPDHLAQAPTECSGSVEAHREGDAGTDSASRDVHSVRQLADQPQPATAGSVQ